MPAYLRHEESLIELVDGEFLVGRSSGCDLALDDGLVSRKHALFRLSGDELLLKDLGSRNGTLRNGEKMTEVPVALSEGDRVTVGSHEFVVTFSANTTHQERERSITSPADLPPPVSPEEVTTKASGLALILNIAEKALGMGRYADAERIITPQLQSFLERSASGEREQVTLDRVARVCLDLALGTGTSKWVDAVFDIYKTTEQIPTAEVVDALHEVVRAIGYMELGPIRSCLQELHERKKDLSPTDKFVLQRLRGLEQVIAA